MNACYIAFVVAIARASEHVATAHLGAYIALEGPPECRHAGPAVGAQGVARGRRAVVSSAFGSTGGDRGRADEAVRVVGIAALARAQRGPTPARAVRLAVVIFFLGTVILFFVEDGDLLGQQTDTLCNSGGLGPFAQESRKR